MCWSSNISYCLQVFSLGNKTYEHYNAMGKYVDKRLEELGAKRIFDLGLGDDDGKWVFWLMSKSGLCAVSIFNHVGCH